MPPSAQFFHGLLGFVGILHSHKLELVSSILLWWFGATPVAPFFILRLTQSILKWFGVTPSAPLLDLLSY